MKRRLGSKTGTGFLFMERPFFNVDVELKVGRWWGGGAAGLHVHTCLRVRKPTRTAATQARARHVRHCSIPCARPPARNARPPTTRNARPPKHVQVPNVAMSPPLELIQEAINHCAKNVS